MKDEEEVIDNNGGGEAEQVIVETPEVVRWEIESNETQVHTPIADAFKGAVEVEEVVETPETIVEEAPIVAEEEVIVNQPTIDEETAIKFLADKKGMTVEEFQDSLKPKEQEKLDADLEAYLKYKKDTNRSYADWMKTQENFAELPKENVLLQNLKLENPTLTDLQIDRLYKRQYEYDAEFDDEDVVLDKQINIEKDYQKGLAKLESQKEQYKAVRGSDELVPTEFKEAKEFRDNFIKQQEEYRIANEKNLADFNAKTDSLFTKDFEGFEVTFGDEKTGFNKVVIKPEDIDGTKKELSDISNFNKKFFDDNGNIKDPKAYYRALYFGMNEEKITAHIWNTAQSKLAEEDEKESKNIQVIGQANKNAPLANQVKRWTVEE